MPDLLFGFENYEDRSEYAGGDRGKWARGGMIVLAPVYKTGAVGTEQVFSFCSEWFGILLRTYEIT